MGILVLRGVLFGFGSMTQNSSIISLMELSQVDDGCRRSID